MIRLLKDAAEAIERGRRFVTHDVWHIGLPGEEIPHGFIIKNIRVAILLLKGLVRDHLALRASALTFATILAIVPFLAIMFFVIETFNLGEGISELLAPLTGATAGDSMTSAELKNKQLWDQFIGLLFRGFEEDAVTGAGQDLHNPVQTLVGFAERGSDPKTLTLAGVIFVLTAVFGLMMNIESCFNTIWGITRTRSWYRMFSDYLMVLLLLPFVVAAMLSLTAALESGRFKALLGPFAFGLRGVQIVGAWLVFTALYFIVPNTRMKFRYPLLAGVVAGTLWCFLSYAYVRFQYGLPRYNLLYSTFAQIPVLLMWVYLSWLIVLLGAELTFAYQNEKTFAMERLAEGASYAYKEALGLWALMQLGRRFDAGEPGLAAAAAAEEWNVPTRLLNEVLDELQEGGLVTQSASNPPKYYPARSLDKTTVSGVVTCLRESGRDPSALRQYDVLRALLDKISVNTTALATCTIADLVRQAASDQPSSQADGAPRVEKLFKE